jgi:hypothetical protein
MTIDTSYFQGDLSIGQITSPAVIASVNLFIQKFEDEFLTRLLGYSLYKAFKAAMLSEAPEQRFIDLRDGKEYQWDGVVQKWRGLVFNSDGSQVVYTDQSFSDIRFKIGDGGIITPSAGDSFVVIGSLAGLTIDDFNIFRNGTYYYPTNYTFDSATGKIALIYPDVFGPTDEVLITRKVIGVTTGGVYKRSPIANYVYYQYLKDSVSFTMGAGEVTPQADVASSPKLKMTHAWNEMARMNVDLYQFMNANTGTYPEYINSLYSFNIFGSSRNRINLFKPITL